MSKTFYVGAKGLIVKHGRVLILSDRGFLDLPGGRLDDDETAPQALQRELNEELPGITEIDIGPLVGWHRPLDYEDGGNSLFLVVFKVDARVPDPVELSDEHESAEWMTLDRARDVLARMSIDWRAVIG